MPSIIQFISVHAGDSVMGDLCSELLNDEEFNKLQNDTSRLNYILDIKEMNPKRSEAVDMFIDEYSL